MATYATLLPQAGKPSEVPLEREEDHAKSCTDQACSRCCFWRSFHGYQRKPDLKLEHAKTSSSDSSWAWKKRFTFENKDGKQQCWLCVRPPSWGGPWAFGCWACNQVFGERMPSRMARVEAQIVETSALQKHESTALHRKACDELKRSSCAASLDQLGPEAVQVSCIVDAVPRLDRWLHAASLVEKCDSFADLKRAVEIGAVGSALREGDCKSDASVRVARNCIVCLAEPLRWRDIEMLRGAKYASIGIDERDSVMLMYARILTIAGEIYDCFLGSVRGYGTLPGDCRRAIVDVVRTACSVRVDRQGQTAEQGNLVLCEKTLRHFRKIVVSAVADGGPVEQKALFECSPGALDREHAVAPFFPNLTEISRDKAHRLRSMQRGVWVSVDEEIRTFLDELVTGEGSLARMLQTSKKYQMVFQAASGRQCAPGAGPFLVGLVAWSVGKASGPLVGRFGPWCVCGYIGDGRAGERAARVCRRVSDSSQHDVPVAAGQCTSLANRVRGRPLLGENSYLVYDIMSHAHA